RRYSPSRIKSHSTIRVGELLPPRRRARINRQAAKALSYASELPSRRHRRGLDRRRIWNAIDPGLRAERLVALASVRFPAAAFGGLTPPREDRSASRCDAGSRSRRAPGHAA